MSNALDVVYSVVRSDKKFDSVTLYSPAECVVSIVTGTLSRDEHERLGSLCRAAFGRKRVHQSAASLITLT